MSNFRNNIRSSQHMELTVKRLQQRLVRQVFDRAGSLLSWHQALGPGQEAPLKVGQQLCLLHSCSWEAGAPLITLREVPVHALSWQCRLRPGCLHTIHHPLEPCGVSCWVSVLPHMSVNRTIHTSPASVSQSSRNVFQDLVIPPVCSRALLTETCKGKA